MVSVLSALLISSPSLLQRNHPHLHQRNYRARHIPTRERHAIDNAQPDQCHSDVHAAVHGIGSASGAEVQGSSQANRDSGAAGCKRSRALLSCLSNNQGRELLMISARVVSA
jgi:hypothetical protein